MKTLECWVLRCADSDMTWVGLNWLRPATHDHIGTGYILLSSLLLGLPGIIAGADMLYLVFGQVQASVWLSLIMLVLAVETLLHLVFAIYWNRRARQLTVGTG